MPSAAGWYFGPVFGKVFLLRGMSHRCPFNVEQWRIDSGGLGSSELSARVDRTMDHERFGAGST